MIKVFYRFLSNVGLNPVHSHSADYILFQSFEIRGYILNNQTILFG